MYAKNDLPIITKVKFTYRLDGVMMGLQDIHLT